MATLEARLAAVLALTGLDMGSIVAQIAETASEATMQALVDKIKLNDSLSALMVGNARAKFRDGFKDLDEWALVGALGSGQTVTVGGAANGSRYVTFSSGTVINAETVYQSIETFSPPFKFGIGVSASQNIANTEFHVELVEVDDAGVLIEDVVLGASPLFKNARNGMGFYLNGTTTSSAVGKLRADGISELSQAVAITKTQTGTNPNFAPTQEVTMLCLMDLFEMQTRAINSIGSPTGLMVRKDYVPRPWAKYAIRLRVKNLGTAPASNTDFRVYWVNVLDAARLSVDFGTVGGTNATDIALATRILTMPTVTINAPALAASLARTGFMAGAGIWYDDTSTALAANANFTGTARDATLTASATAFANAATYAKEVRLSAESDVTGTLWLEVSRDNTNWRRVKSIATAAVAGGGFYAELVHSPSWRYWRGGYTNGATLQNRFSFNSLAMAA